MEIADITGLMDEISSLETDIKRMTEAIVFAHRHGKAVLALQKQGGSNISYIIPFEKEIAVACYQAKLGEYKAELLKINTRIGGWK